jgi:hypothetical protein
MHGTNTKNGVVQYKEGAVMMCCGVMLLDVETTRLYLDQITIVISILISYQYH